jgi:hypothetical protein
MTDDEAVAYDSGVVDGRVAERERLKVAGYLTYERGYADGEDTGRENAKQAINALFPQIYGSYEQGLTDALAAIDGLQAAEPVADPFAKERKRILDALLIAIGVYGGYYPVVTDALMGVIELVDVATYNEIKTKLDGKKNV